MKAQPNRRPNEGAYVRCERCFILYRYVRGKYPTPATAPRFSRSLIEAATASICVSASGVFPPLFAGASLKLLVGGFAAVGATLAVARNPQTVRQL